MKKLTTVLFALMLLLITTTAPAAQNISPRLTNVADVVKQVIQEKLPGWMYQSVTPIEGSKNTVIEQ